MLHSVRSNVFLALDAAIESHALLHRSFRVHAFHARNVILDDALFLRAFARLGQLDRSVVTCVLEGQACVTTGASRSWVSAGEGFWLARKAPLALRCEATPTYRTLVFEWAGAPANAAPAQTTFALDAARPTAEWLWHALRAPIALPPIRRRLVRLFGELQTLGVPLQPPDNLVEHVPPRLAQISAVLDEQLSQLDAKPMTVDLQERLGLSMRQLSRLVRELHERFGFNADGWIDVRNRRRTMLAVALLSTGTASVADVARAVGYSGAQVMARALATAGLPTPRSIASVLREMRAAAPS